LTEHSVSRVGAESRQYLLVQGVGRWYIRVKAGRAAPRRRFLKGGACLLALATLALATLALATLGVGDAAISVLRGCAADLTGSGALPLPRPDNPVKWPVFAGNASIKSGLEP
jgi:hypothetical protein